MSNNHFVNICLALVSCWSLYIFFYGIVLPEIRDRYRYRLFAQRDRLHRLYLTYQLAPNDDVYSSALDMLNAQIRILDHLDIPTIVYTLISTEGHNRENLASLLETKRDSMNQQLFDAYRDILKKSIGSVIKALRWNSLFLFITVQLISLRKDTHQLKTVFGKHFNRLVSSISHFLTKKNRLITNLCPGIYFAYDLLSQKIPRK